MSFGQEYLPKYQLFANEIERQIRANELLDGVPLPSLRALIRDYGVSQPTVERGLKILLERNLLKHYEGRGYFVANRKPLRLSVRKIALITPQLDSDTNLYLKGISETLDPEKYICSTFSAHSDLGKFQQTLNQVAQLDPAGVIIYTIPKEICRIDVSALLGAGIPIVAIEPYLPEILCDRVLISQQNMVKKAARYIIENNLRDLAMLIGPPRWQKDETIKAFRLNLKGSGIDLPDERIFMLDISHGYADPPDPYISGELKMTELLENGFRGTLICGHDYPAIGAMRALMKAGVKVPEQIKLLSIMSCASSGFSPMKLTTVDFSPSEIAHVATKLLMRRIKGYKGPLETHYISGDIIEGETT